MSTPDEIIQDAENSLTDEQEDTLKKLRLLGTQVQNVANSPAVKPETDDIIIPFVLLIGFFIYLEALK